MGKRKLPPNLSFSHLRTKYAMGAAGLLFMGLRTTLGKPSVIDQLVLFILQLIRNHQIVCLLWAVASLVGVMFYWKRPRPVFLVDFACYKPADEHKCNYELAQYITKNSDKFTLPSMEFQRKIFLRSGLGDETYLPPFIFKGIYEPGHDDARLEAEQVMFGSVNELLKNTRVNPKDIKILITNCSLFAPIPCHSSIIVNRFKMRSDVKNVNLSGMGCSSSGVACALAKDLLNLYPDQYALIVSTENITLNWYSGNDKSMLVTNCLFRVGCAAVLLTNKQQEKSRSKYELLHCIRTHKGGDDRAYRCAYQREDETGLMGMSLNKDLMDVAADALKANLTILGPLVLPVAEQVKVVFSLVKSRFLKVKANLYQPDFKLAFQHFCLHAGGRAVIDCIQKNLFLSDYLVEPSRATLHRFGNTSTSSFWYILAYMEAKQRVKKSDKVWMIGLGAGFECNSAVWKALNDIALPADNPWLDCVHRYPAPASVMHV